MRTKTKPRLALSAAWFLGGAVVGCGPTPSSNLSPTPEQDPARHLRAVRETEEKARKDREAERNAFRGLGRSAPNP
jgi:hypothetical protein